MSILEIKNLHASVEGKKILNGIDLVIKSGETHAIMGPNGTGKSTLLNVIMGHPNYKVLEGSITLDGEDVLSMTVDERSRKGLFLAMQAPIEVPGVTTSDFLRQALESRNEAKDDMVSIFRFMKELSGCAKDLAMPEDMASRYLNEGFSGGEKKKNEILQLKMLKPKFAFLDETDSGLDVDAIKIVSDNVNKEKDKGLGLLLITHYRRLLDLIKPEFVHVMINGKIVMNGPNELLYEIDEKGYEWVKRELNIKDKEVVTLGTCGAKK